MSRKYKFLNQSGLYFVSFATINWIDVFIRPVYNDIVVQSLNYCKSNLGLEIYCWCMMPSHLHLIFRAKEENPSKVIGRFKEHTSKKLLRSISENQEESRQSWMLAMFRNAGENCSNVKFNQFWQHNNKPIELWSPWVVEQKFDYTHHNPVAAGFVLEDWHWKYSSAIDYAGGKGLVDIDFIR